MMGASSDLENIIIMEVLLSYKRDNLNTVT